MKLSARSYMQATQKNMRKFGDGLLAVGSTITAASITGDEPTIALIALGVTVLGKFLTNFFTE